jgi:hypothetical protein
MTAEASEVPARFRSAVRTDELPLAFVWARVPRPRTARATFLSIHFVVEAIDLVRGKLKLRELGERSVAMGFPLDRNMAMLATDARLVIWRASRRGSAAPTLLGEVSRGQIASARLPFIGGGRWPPVEVNLINGQRVRFLADGQGAERFAQVLSGQD